MEEYKAPDTPFCRTLLELGVEPFVAARGKNS